MDIGDDLMLEVHLHEGKPQLLISSSCKSNKRKLTTKSIHGNNKSRAAKTQGNTDVPNADAERIRPVRLAALHDRMCKSTVNSCPFQNGQHVNGTRLNVGPRTVTKASQVTASGLGSRSVAQERHQSLRGKPKSTKTTASLPNESKPSKARPRLEQQNSLPTTVGKSRPKHNDHIQSSGMAATSGAKERLQVLQKRKSGRVMKDLNARFNTVNNVPAKGKATNNLDDQVAEKPFVQECSRTQSPGKAESQETHLNPPLDINHQTILLNQEQTTQVQDNAQNGETNGAQEAYGGLWNMIGERMKMKDKLQSNRAQWIRELEEQVQLKHQQQQKEMCTQQNVEGWDTWWRTDRVPSQKKQILFHDEDVSENRDTVQHPQVLLENKASLELPEAGSGCSHAASVDNRAVERQHWLEELNRQRDEAQLRRAQERQRRYADSDHSQFEKHFDSFRPKPLPLSGQSQSGRHTDCSQSTEPVQSRFVATVSDTTQAVEKPNSYQLKSSYPRNTAVLMDPAQLEERERNRIKQMQHQKALAEQMEEQQKRRQAESELRRRQEEEEEQRIAQEQCIMQKQRQDELERKCQQEMKKEQLRKQIEQQHKSVHRAPELASQARRELRAFQNNHGGQGTGDPKHVLTECRMKGRDEPSLTSSLSVEKSVQTEEGDARVPPQGPISARKAGRTLTAPGGSGPTSTRAMPRVREQPKPTGHRGVDRRASVPKEPCSTQQQKPLRATKGLATQITPGREHSDKTTERSTVRPARTHRTDATPTTRGTLNKLRVQGMDAGIKPPAAEGLPTSSSGGSRKGPPGAVGVSRPFSHADLRPLNPAAHREVVFSNLTRLRKGLQQKRNELEKSFPLHRLPGTDKVSS